MGKALEGSAGSGCGADFEGQNGRSVIVEALSQLFIGPVLGLAASGCPHAPNVVAGIAHHVTHVTPVIHVVGEDFPLLERQRLSHFAVLYLPRGVMVADALLRVAVEDDADVVGAIGHEHAGLTVGDHAAPDLRGYVGMTANVVTVVVRLSPCMRRPRGRMCLGVGMGIAVILKR